VDIAEPPEDPFTKTESQCTSNETQSQRECPTGNQMNPNQPKSPEVVPSHNSESLQVKKSSAQVLPNPEFFPLSEAKSCTNTQPQPSTTQQQLRDGKLSNPPPFTFTRRTDLKNYVDDSKDSRRAIWKKEYVKKRPNNTITVKTPPWPEWKDQLQEDCRLAGFPDVDEVVPYLQEELNSDVYWKRSCHVKMGAGKNKPDGIQYYGDSLWVLEETHIPMEYHPIHLDRRRVWRYIFFQETVHEWILLRFLPHYPTDYSKGEKPLKDDLYEDALDQYTLEWANDNLNLLYKDLFVNNLV